MPRQGEHPSGGTGLAEAGAVAGRHVVDRTLSGQGGLSSQLGSLLPPNVQNVMQNPCACLCVSTYGSNLSSIG